METKAWTQGTDQRLGQRGWGSMKKGEGIKEHTSAHTHTEKHRHRRQCGDSHGEENWGLVQVDKEGINGDGKRLGFG